MPKNKKKRNVQDNNNATIDRLLSVFAEKIEPDVVNMVFLEANRDEAVATEQLLMIAGATDVVHQQDEYKEFTDQQGYGTTESRMYGLPQIEERGVLPSTITSPSVEILTKIQENNKKITIILRGLPGSGKSYLAKQLKGDGLIISADHYFTDRHGHYQYKPSKLREAHQYAQTKARAAMKEGVTPVIVDNTNIELWEMLPYVKSSIKHKYTIEVLEPDTWWKYVPHELAKRNKHNVSKEKIEKMYKRYVHNVTPNDLIVNLDVPNSLNRSRSKSLDRIQQQNDPATLYFSNSVDYSHLNNDTSHFQVLDNGNTPANLKVIDEPGIDQVLDELLTESLKCDKAAKSREDEGVPRLIELCYDKTRNANEGFAERTFDQENYNFINNCQHSEQDLIVQEPLQGFWGTSIPPPLDVKGSFERHFSPEDSEPKVESIESSSNLDWQSTPTKGKRRHRPNRYPPKETNGNLNWTALNGGVWESVPEVVQDIAPCVNHDASFPKGPHAIDQEHPKPRRGCQKTQAETAETFWESSEHVLKEPAESEDNIPRPSDLSLDDSSIISHSETSILSQDSDVSATGHRSSRRRGKRGSRLAAKFDNEWILEEAPKEVPEALVTKPEPIIPVTVHSATMTEVQDFKNAFRAWNGHIPDDIAVVSTKAERFIPASLVEGIVLLNKSCSAQLDEEEPQLDNPVEHLCKLFPDCSYDLIADFLADCHNNVSWAVNLLLDSGYILSGEDVTFSLDEVEAGKVLKQASPKSSDDSTLKEGFPEEVVESFDSMQKETVAIDSSSKELHRQSDIVQEEMEAIDSTLKSISTEDLLRELEGIDSALKEMLPEAGLAEEEIEVVDPLLKIHLPNSDVLQILETISSKLKKIIPHDGNLLETADEETSLNDGCSDQNSLQTAVTDEISAEDDSCLGQTILQKAVAEEISTEDDGCLGQTILQKAVAEEISTEDDGCLGQTILQTAVAEEISAEDDSCLGQSILQTAVSEETSTSSEVDDGCPEENVQTDVERTSILDEGCLGQSLLKTAVEEVSAVGDVCPDQNSDSHESVTSGDVSYPTVVEHLIKDRTESPENSSDEEDLISERLLSKVVLDPKSMSDHRRRVAVRNKQTRTESPSGSSSCSNSGSSSEESVEDISLTMDFSFAKQLVDNFGSPLFGLDISEFSTSDLQVALPADLCARIYDCWGSTLRQKHASQMKDLERIIKEDEGKKSVPVATTEIEASAPASMKEIMDLETALQKSLIDQDNSQVAMQNAKTYAQTLATDKLQKRFPQIDGQTLQQVFTSNGDDYMKTVQMLMSGAQENQDERHPNDVIMNPTPEDFRAEAAFYHQLKKENYRKAQEAHDKKMYEVATFYAKQGRILDDKVREANRRASESILTYNNSKQPGNTLDLHHLFVNDALQVLSQWMEEMDKPMSKWEHVYVVTGWGKHSHPKRQPRLRPAVIEHLKNYQYEFVEENRGKFRVKTKRSKGASK